MLEDAHGSKETKVAGDRKGGGNGGGRGGNETISGTLCTMQATAAFPLSEGSHGQVLSRRVTGADSHFNGIPPAVL